MISVGANRNRKAYGIKHYNIDTEQDLQGIDVNYEIMGTTAFVIETSQRYMLNGSKVWVKIAGTPGGGSGSGDSVQDGGGVDGSGGTNGEVWEGGDP